MFDARTKVKRGMLQRRFAMSGPHVAQSQRLVQRLTQFLYFVKTRLGAASAILMWRDGITPPPEDQQLWRIFFEKVAVTSAGASRLLSLISVYIS